MSDWQPIETAPRDGTRVLLWVPFSDYPVVCYFLDAGFWANWQIEEENMEVSGDGVIDPSFHGDPTHWMPLPEPPK